VTALDITNKQVSIVIFLLAYFWLFLFPPVGTTFWTPDLEFFVPDLVVEYRHDADYEGLVAFGPMIRIGEAGTEIFIHYPAWVSGPSTLINYYVLFLGNLIILVSLMSLGLILWRKKNTQAVPNR